MIPDFYLNFEITFSIGSPIYPPTVILPGGKLTWHYLRRKTTLDSLPRENTWEFLRREVSLYDLQREITFNNLRREITFYKGYEMANQDPFVVSKGGKLVEQKIFLNPLRVSNDTIVSDVSIEATQSATGFTVSNIHRNASSLTNEDGIIFPANTVIIFDVVAPADPDFDEALLYFEFTSTAGLNLKVSHPIRVPDAIEAR